MALIQLNNVGLRFNVRRFGRISLKDYLLHGMFRRGKKPTFEVQALDGVNLIPHLAGENKAVPHERLFWRTGGGSGWAVREGRYKLLKNTGEKQPQLYDLDADIGETRDLAAEKPDVVQRLTAAFEAWNAQLIAPLFESPRPGAKKQQQQRKKAAAQ